MALFRAFCFWVLFFAHVSHGRSTSAFSTHALPNSSSLGMTSIVTNDLFDKIFLHRNESSCTAHGFYTYSAFLEAAGAFEEFGNEGDLTSRKRELAAFFAQISHETTGGWPTAPDGPYAWGLCYKEEKTPPINYCNETFTQWPCVPGKSYFGRGPIQLSWNFNYGPAGEAAGFDGLKNPELVASDAVIAFKTALWFWMTPKDQKPSCHDVMVGKWKTSSADEEAKRLPGFGLVTNIVNGRVECGRGPDARVQDRIGFYKRYSSLMGVDPGLHLDCADQTPFSS